MATVLVAACGEASSSGTTGDIPPAPGYGGSGGPPPFPSASVPAMPAPEVVAPVDGRRERVAAWRLADRDDDGRTLLLDVAISGPPCDAVTGVDVVQNDTTVTVTVYAGRRTGASCPPGVAASLGTARVAAHLREPLGTRRLLGSTS